MYSHSLFRASQWTTVRTAFFKYLLVFGLGFATLLLGQSVWRNLAFCHRQYDLLNPARRCTEVPSQGEWNYEHLRDVLSAKKEELKSSGTLSHLSIYFQDLDHGPRFGIGEYDKFYPASLLKVPLLIFFLHGADLNPQILEKTLSFTDDVHVADNVRSPEATMEPGTAYTIRDLLTKMIVHSDNRSYAVLLREMHALSENVAYLTFRDLDVLQMMLESKETYVSISSYAKLFAVLYNTGYLSKEMSQLALQLLSQATFRDGMKAGLPGDVRVAHKFGFSVSESQSQLHDCGIVYHPKTSYILCVMTSGQDQNKENAAIVDISRTVYDAVSSLNFHRSMQADRRMN